MHDIDGCHHTPGHASFNGNMAQCNLSNQAFYIWSSRHMVAECRRTVGPSQESSFSWYLQFKHGRSVTWRVYLVNTLVSEMLFKDLTPRNYGCISMHGLQFPTNTSKHFRNTFWCATPRFWAPKREITCNVYKWRTQFVLHPQTSSAWYGKPSLPCYSGNNAGPSEKFSHSKTNGSH